MIYKDLNVYKRAYKVAIDLHIFLNSEKVKISPQQTEGLKSLSREILANIAEGFSQKTSKAKRYFNFRALDATRRMVMDLDFLHDIQSLPSEEYERFNKEYEICAAQIYKLNQSILNKEIEKESSEPVKA
jgi:four helix bundle protein